MLPLDARATADAGDPIKHVVLLLLENRSFDQMLGCFKKTYPDLEGIDIANPAMNTDDNGNQFFQVETEEQQMPRDPRHETEHVLEQLRDNNSGFVRDFARYYPASDRATRQLIMSYYRLMFLDSLHRMARDFTICDHWFASVPGPTWANRFFALSGTASGRVTMPEIDDPEQFKELFLQPQDTIFDRLDEANRSSKIYYYDFPCSLIFRRQQEIQNLAKYFPIDQFFRDVRKPAEFPDFVFIEPKYFGQDQNDDHPPHNIMKGEKLIGDVYNAIRSNENLWASTLLIVLYDEHGGFYDHVPPPPAVPPDEHQEEYSFDRLGVRVPAVLVSPWVSKRVESTQFDHTSVLKYMTNKWDLGPLGRRTAEANSIGIAITESTLRTDTLPFVRVSYSHLVPPRPDLEKMDSSEHHTALQAFASYLRHELDETPGAILEEVAKVSRFIMAKAWIGRHLIRLGNYLTRELDENNQKRVKIAMDVVIAFLKRGVGTSA